MTEPTPTPKKFELRLADLIFKRYLQFLLPPQTKIMLNKAEKACLNPIPNRKVAWGWYTSGSEPDPIPDEDPVKEPAQMNLQLAILAFRHEKAANGFPPGLDYKTFIRNFGDTLEFDVATKTYLFQKWLALHPKSKK